MPTALNSGRQALPPSVPTPTLLYIFDDGMISSVIEA